MKQYQQYILILLIIIIVIMLITISYAYRYSQKIEKQAEQLPNEFSLILQKELPIIIKKVFGSK